MEYSYVKWTIYLLWFCRMATQNLSKSSCVDLALIILKFYKISHRMASHNLSLILMPLGGIEFHVIMLPNFILTYACFGKHYSRKYCWHPWLTDTVNNLVIGSSCGNQFSVMDMMQWCDYEGESGLLHDVCHPISYSREMINGQGYVKGANISSKISK